MRGKTELHRKRLVIDGIDRPHPFRLQTGEISEYVLIGYRKKGHRDQSVDLVNITEINGDTVTLEFVRADDAWMQNCPKCNGAGCRKCKGAGNVEKHTIDSMPTAVMYTRTAKFV